MNEAVLVIMLFTVNPYGQPEDLRVVTESFETMEQCNYVGKNLRELIYKQSGQAMDPRIKSTSYCVHYSEFKKPV